MNIHPLVVHFPIALLFLYSVIQLLPLRTWFPRVEWKQIERVLLVVGFFGALVALATGDTAEHIFHPNRQLVEMHSTFAGLATVLYGALLSGEILTIINPKILPKISYTWIRNILISLEKLLCNKTFSKTISLVALIAISTTGLLGGVMVYGATADPVAGIVLKMLGITI